jgi:hypothetical protein
MGKYASWNELEKSVPISYKEKATPEAFRTGMNGIARPGSRLRKGVSITTATGWMVRARSWSPATNGPCSNSSLAA